MEMTLWPQWSILHWDHNAISIGAIFHWVINLALLLRINICSWFRAPMEKAWFYERMCFEVITVMVKVKKMQYKEYTISMKISFMYYMKWTRVMFLVIFEEFQIAYIFLLLFSFHFHCQLVKGQIWERSWAEGCSPPQPPVSTGLL